MNLSLRLKFIRKAHIGEQFPINFHLVNNLNGKLPDKRLPVDNMMITIFEASSQPRMAFGLWRSKMDIYLLEVTITVSWNTLDEHSIIGRVSLEKLYYE